MDKFLDTFLRKLSKLFHLNLSDKFLLSLIQFIKFGIIGVSNTLVSYLINLGVLWAMAPLHLSWDYIAGNIVAFLLSVLWSFYWNNKYVFSLKEGQMRNTARALLKTYVAYSVTGVFINNILSFFWINLLHISKAIAPLLNIVIDVPLNFLINKLWAFKATDK